ncbi:hypothetical protein BV22DRAFT_1146203 [Leucogyrophana mollusca]|uniref:Uncharacterized protein n=1 Tax=Leucogyrophana mollusca TaxID=85980 RepID=A0ACB8BTA2_9AGAM|nr:hypothetical protein BV22DRAFT_1146203 [Leucogyrophana mollusca]
MVQFLDLPLELLPLVFSHVVRPQHLAVLCLVNRSFHTFALPRLYQRVFIYAWHKKLKYIGCLRKIALLFRTLAECAHLAKFVEKIEIRDFPKALSSSVHTGLMDLCTRGIQNCVNLRSCTWTRDGSINSAVLCSLQTCHNLQELEINGHDTGAYNPITLVQFQRLSKISLIMPSVHVLEVLPSWMSVTGATLRNLTLIFKSSPLLTDTLLEHIAPSLTELDHLHITGCPKVTHHGIGALVTTNRRGLVGLGLEGLSHSFDMAEFTRQCSKNDAIRRLRAITVTVDAQTPLQTWMGDVTALLSVASLENFQIYATSPLTKVQVTDEFWRSIVNTHAKHLTRLSVHRMQISINALLDICSRCSLLEQIFVVAERHDLDAVAQCLARVRKLRIAHVNFPLESSEHVAPSLLMHDVLSVVRQCSPTMTQIGCNTRVWQVNRSVSVRANGDMVMEASLAPYENPDVPEPFLVMRT